MSDEFDITTVHQLVDDVLDGRRGGRVVPPVSPTPSARQLAFSHGDTRLLATLATILPNHGVHRAEVQLILDELRDELRRDFPPQQLPMLHALARVCRRCPDLGDAILPLGNLADPDAVFVIDHAETSWPPLLVDALGQAELIQQRCALTFAARCQGRSGEGEIANCQSYLLSEIETLQPKLVLLLGTAVTSALLGTVRIQEVHGTILWVGTWAFMPIYAPGYVERRASGMEELVGDLRNARRYLYGDER